MMQLLEPTLEEQNRRDQVITTILDCIRSGTTIWLPDFDPTISRPSDQYALTSVGIEPNPYGGSIGDYRYQFEGEEDLLHLIIVRHDGEVLNPAESQAVASFLYPGVPTAMMWYKAGTVSHHFYLGHDILLEYLA